MFWDFFSVCQLPFLIKYLAFISFSIYNNYKIFSNFLYHIFDLKFFSNYKIFSKFFKLHFRHQNFFRNTNISQNLLGILHFGFLIKVKKNFQLENSRNSQLITFSYQIYYTISFKLANNFLPHHQIFSSIFPTSKFSPAPYFCKYFSYL